MKNLSTGVSYTPASAYQFRITLQSADTTADDLGGLSSRVPFASNIWASVKGLTGRELFKAQQVVAEATHMVTIRYRPGVLSNMIVLFKGRLFNIVDVTDPDERNVELRLLCVERNDGTVA